MNPKKASIFAFIGAGIVLVAFFLPFLQINMLGITWSANGYELASGNLSGVDGADVLGNESAASLWLFVLGAVIALVVTALFSLKKQNAKTAGISNVVAGLVIIAIWAMKVIDLNGSISKANEQLSSYGSLLGDVSKFSLFSVMGIGFWITVIGGILIAVSGFLMMKPSSQGADNATSAVPSDTNPNVPPTV